MIQKLKKYLQRPYAAIAWTLLILILVSIPGSMLPPEQSFGVPNIDKLVHTTLFGGFVILWCCYYAAKALPLKRLLRIFFIIFIIASAYGVGTELLQKYYIPMRDFDLADILADWLGAGLGYGISNITMAGKSSSKKI